MGVILWGAIPLCEIGSPLRRISIPRTHKLLDGVDTVIELNSEIVARDLLFELAQLTLNLA